jgi:AraC-like DNA-binding protein
MILAGALAGGVVGLVMDDLDALLPPRLEAWMRQLLVEAHRSLAPADAASLYHAHTNTLRQHLRGAGLPPVNKMIIWARLFHAAHLLAEPARSVESVAFALDFASATALRNELRRYAGMTPAEVRRGGGLLSLLARFRERYGNVGSGGGRSSPGL